MNEYRTAISNELADWICTTGLAELILYELEEQEVPVTLLNGKTAWLDALGVEIPNAISSSVKAIFHKEVPRMERTHKP